MTISSVTKDGTHISYVEDGATKTRTITGAEQVFSYPPVDMDRVTYCYRRQSDGILVVAYIDTNGDEQTLELDPTATDDLTGAEIVVLLEALGSGSRLSHTKLDDVGASDHHAKYTDAEAKTQAEAAKLDDHTVPDDNTDLDASGAKHGLMPKADSTKLAGIATGADVTGSNAPQAHKDSHDPSGSDPLDTAAAAEISVVVAAGEGTAETFARADHIHAISHAITDNHIVTVDGTVNSGEYLKATASGAEGKTVAEVVTDLALVHTINFIIDGGGSAITTGVKGDLVIDYACTITAVTMLADQSGSIVVDIWKDTYANYPPTDADSITASAVPTITTATNSQDSTLTGWTTAITAGDTLRFNVDSITTCERVTVSLKVTRT